MVLYSHVSIYFPRSKKLEFFLRLFGFFSLLGKSKEKRKHKIPEARRRSSEGTPLYPLYACPPSPRGQKNETVPPPPVFQITTQKPSSEGFFTLSRV